MASPLLNYLEAQPGHPVPPQDSRPNKKEWVDFCDFELTGSRLCFSDSWCPFEGVTVNLLPGVYAVRALCYSYGSDVRVAALRVAPKGIEGTLGESAGEFCVDVGAAGITDLDQIEKLDEETYETWIESYIHGDAVYQAAGIHPCPQGNTKMPYASIGFGDGCYGVYPIMLDGKAVGAEARFLEEDATYPFSPQIGRPKNWERFLTPISPFIVFGTIIGTVVFMLCAMPFRFAYRIAASVYRKLAGRRGA